ncbi:bidirectional sugar transporter SWEET17 [Coffea arabica]|nr:bidirectional sugar transporter SWEET17-like [Coffea arabica]XP_027117051.1 bidirectional sugar transporter SWEET17-like [Coffea arabica]
MEGFTFFIGILGNVTSMLVFLAPIDTFKRIVKNKSTEEFDSLPYICSLLSASLWTYYGIVQPSAFLVGTINAFGSVLGIVYVGLFLFYAPPSNKVKIALIVGTLNVGFLAGAILFTRLAFKGEARVASMGFLAAGFIIVTYASPLSSMRTVVMTRSVEYMPFYLSFFIFLSGGVWALYGWLIGDYFVSVPNGTGCILGTAQLVLYGIYRDTKPPARDSACVSFYDLEEGWQRQPLLSSTHSLVSSTHSLVSSTHSLLASGHSFLES